MRRVFLSFLHEDIWEVNQFRAVIGNEYVGAMAYDESLKDPVRSLNATYIKPRLTDMIDRASMAILLLSNDTWEDPSGWLRWEMTTAWDLGKDVAAMKFKNAPGARDPSFLNGLRVVSATWNVATIRRWMND
jgi:hypothetical protein